MKKGLQSKRHLKSNLKKKVNFGFDDDSDSDN
jgi:hypothetical protein